MTKHFAPFGGYIGLGDFARRVGISYLTAWRWVKTGRISAHKIGAFWVVPETELEKAQPRNPFKPRV
ncbi:MAG: helix-turn-helix domain-containing protein [Bacteroidia bacterium]|nr:helix-turn-helix domain-containing protein [Bacteroidia bacterium]